MEDATDYQNTSSIGGAKSLDEMLIRTHIIGVLRRGAYPVRELPHDVAEHLRDSGISADVPNVHRIIIEMLGNQILIEPFGDISYARLSGKRDYI